MKQTQSRIGALLLIAAAAVAGCAGDRAGANPPAAAAQASRPRGATYVVPAGTSVIASLQTPLSTDRNHSGDAFVATTVDRIVIDGKTVVPAGAQLRGVLQDVQDSGRIKGRARMTLLFQDIVDAQGKSHGIAAEPLILQASSGTGDDVEKIAAGGIAGAIIGAIAGGTKGAVIGTAVGAGAGTVVVLATKGDDIELNAGQRLNVQMTAPTSITLVALR